MKHKKENEIFDCERFFHSTWFEWLCDINPDKLIDGIKKYVNSTSLIDSFIDGDYDEYEVTCISSKNYGWLMIELATLED